MFDTACSEDSCEDQVHVFKPVHTLEGLILDDSSTWRMEEEKYKYETYYQFILSRQVKSGIYILRKEKIIKLPLIYTNENFYYWPGPEWKNIGLIRVKEEGWTGFLEGKQGYSEDFPKKFKQSCILNAQRFWPNSKIES